MSTMSRVPRTRHAVAAVSAVIAVILAGIGAASFFAPAAATSADEENQLRRVVTNTPRRAAPTPEPVVAPTVTAGVDGIIRVSMFGDSLAWEAREHFDGAFAGVMAPVEVTSSTMGGTALCDFNDLIESALTATEVDALIIAFSGNALTPCMLDALGSGLVGEEHTAAYSGALEVVIEATRRTETALFIAIAPVSRDDTAEAAALRVMLREASTTDPFVHAIDTGDVLTVDGTWTETLPCLDFEDDTYGCIDGEIIVRAPDGAHYCPGSGPAVGGVTDTCGRWASGAYRYAMAIAAPVIAAIVA